MTHTSYGCVRPGRIWKVLARAQAKPRPRAEFYRVVEFTHQASSASSRGSARKASVDVLVGPVWV